MSYLLKCYSQEKSEMVFVMLLIKLHVMDLVDTKKKHLIHAFSVAVVTVFTRCFKDKEKDTSKEQLFLMK